MSCDPVPLLVGGMDMRAWAGQKVATIGGVDVFVAASVEDDDLDVDDVETALNGRGAAPGCSLGALLDAAVAGSGVTVGIDGDNRAYIESDTEDFAIIDTAVSRAAGWPAGAAAVGGGAPYRQTAPGPWHLGEVYGGATGLSIDLSFTGVVSVAPRHWWPNFIVALRERGSDDADDRLPTQAFEQTAHDAITAEYSFKAGLVDGRTKLGWDVSGDVTPDIVWVSTTFRNALGFNGIEEVVTTGDVATVHAARLHPNVQPLYDGLQDLSVGAYLPGDGMEADDGSTDSNGRGRLGRLGLRAWVGGHGHQYDTIRHWIWRVRPDAGRPLSLYMAGTCDPRRNLDPYLVTAETAAHGLVYTVGRIKQSGYEARFPAHLDIDVSELEMPEFRTDRQVRAPIDLVLTLGATGAQ